MPEWLAILLQAVEAAAKAAANDTSGIPHAVLHIISKTLDLAQLPAIQP
jgi:hypothetical protein